MFAKAIRWGAATVNPVRTLERTPEGKRTRYVTDAQSNAVYALANEPMRIAMDLALLTGQGRGDLLSLKRAQLIDEGIVFNPSKPRGRARRVDRRAASDYRTGPTHTASAW